MKRHPQYNTALKLDDPYLPLSMVSLILKDLVVMAKEITSRHYEPDSDPAPKDDCLITHYFNLLRVSLIGLKMMLDANICPCFEIWAANDENRDVCPSIIASMRDLLYTAEMQPDVGNTIEMVTLIERLLPVDEDVKGGLL